METVGSVAIVIGERDSEGNMVVVLELKSRVDRFHSPCSAIGNVVKEVPTQYLSTQTDRKR